MTLQEFKQDLIDWLKLLNADRKNGKRLSTLTSKAHKLRSSEMNEKGEKKCPACGNFKPYNLENFIKDKHRKFGLGSYCRECNRILDREKKRKMREKNNAKRRNSICS